ncbi:MAG TPA: hypothetical protein VFV42_00300 [Acidimicrobiales bacterium]|nr:hypothetical protein [Acidimicrobiales bacterium]
MPSQQRFEGPDLEALLDDVRSRFGDDVSIVEANRIRKGGVGGFFARELYEVVVDGEDDTPAGAGTPRPRSLLDLVDAVQDGPARDEPLFYDVEKLGDLDRAVTPTATELSSEGQAFADVLDRIARATATPPPAPHPVEDDEPFRSYADVAPRPVVAPRPEVVARPAGARTPARPGPSVDHDQLARLGLPAPVLRHAPAGLDRLSTLLHLAESFPAARALPRSGGTVIALVGDRRGMAAAVAWVHEQLGLSPDRLMLASRSESRVFPTSRRFTSSQEVVEHRRAWSRATVPTLVVVDEPVGVRSTAWARHVLDALEPAAVWAVTDAQRKPEDVVAWAERIGGIDAIALDGTEETASPAAVLATGLPVALIDGHTATPARWAAVLDERLLAA